MEDLSTYLVETPKEIHHYLKVLNKEKCLITASFGNNLSFITVILNVDETKQTMVFDCGPTPYLNKKIVDVGLVKCKADFRGVKVFFIGRGIKISNQSGQTILSLNTPNNMYWVQRRQFYRVRSPLSKNSYCTLFITETDKDNNSNLELKLFDISASGMSLLSNSKDIAEYLTLDKKIINCKVTLDGSSSHKISLIVRNKSAINRDKPEKVQRIGCEFINTPHSVESAFLKYMQQIERENKKNFN